MTLSKRALACAVVSLAVAGCASTIKSVVNPPVGPDALKVSADLLAKVNGGKAPKGSNAEGVRESAFSEFEASSPSPDLRQRMVGEMVYDLLTDSDAQCEKYLIAIGVIKNSYNLGLGTLGSGITTAGGIASPLRSANILAAVGGFITGTSTMANGTLFGGKDYEIIYGAIHSGRTQEENAVFSRQRAGDFDTFSLGTIYMIVNNYNNDCGVNYGLHILQNAVTQNAITSNVASGKDSVPGSIAAAPPAPATAPVAGAAAVNTSQGATIGK